MLQPTQTSWGGHTSAPGAWHEEAGVPEASEACHPHPTWETREPVSCKQTSEESLPQINKDLKKKCEFENENFFE